jgi:hypothetical protein
VFRTVAGATALNAAGISVSSTVWVR